MDDNSKVSLSIRGVGVDPDELTDILCSPSRSWRNGDKYYSRLGDEMLRRSGMWAVDREGPNPDPLCREIVDMALPHRNSLLSHVVRTGARAGLGIWWEPAVAPSWFSMGAWMLPSVAAIGCDIDVYYPGARQCFDRFSRRDDGEAGDSAAHDAATVNLVGISKMALADELFESWLKSARLMLSSLPELGSPQGLTTEEFVRWVAAGHGDTMEGALAEALTRAEGFAHGLSEEIVVYALLTWQPVGGQGGFSIGNDLVLRFAALNSIVEFGFLT